MSNYLYLSTTAQGASTPHQAGLVVGTGTLDLRAQIAPINWANGTFQSIITQYGNSNPPWRFGCWLTPTGGLEYDWLDSGSTSRIAVSSVAVGGAANTAKWVRLVHNVSAGTVTFYTSPDGITWTQLGTVASGLSTLAINSTGTAPVVRIGSDATGDNFIGQILQTRVLVGGSTILNIDWTTATAGYGPWTATSGEAWTSLNSTPVVITGGVLPTVPTLAESLATRSQALGQLIISNLSALYENGVFYQNNMADYALDTFPHMALMATLAKYLPASSSLRASYITMIGEIMTRAIATSTDTSSIFLNGYGGGSVSLFDLYYMGPDRASNGTPDSISIIEAVQNISWAVYELPSGTISDAQRTAWITLCKTNCDYLDANGNTTYFTNGNINAQLLGAYWFTSMICTNTTDKLKYQDMYERALAFIHSPATYQPVSFPSPWGLTMDVAASEYDWSDGQAHLTETNTRGADPRPDFDPNYTSLTLDALARVFVMNRDTRIIRLMNALSNKIEPLINTTTWTLDGTGGSRQHNASGVWGAYYPVTALMGCKSSTTTLLTNDSILSMWDTGSGGVNTSLLSNSTNGNYAPGTARQLSFTLATVREASAIAQFRISAT